MAMTIDENLILAVGELVHAYLAGGHGQDRVYMDTATGRYYWVKWEDCVIDDTLYHLFGWGWRIDELPAAALAGIVDESTVQVDGGEYDKCWYCDTDILLKLITEYAEEQKEKAGDE